MKGGLLLADKPAGMGSSLLTGIVKRQSGLRVGHTGTLDRFATGLMLLVLGQATALSDHFLHEDKEYEAEFAFGTATDTHDPEGQATDARPPEEARQFVAEHEVEIRKVIGDFCLVKEQIPPVYSALKQAGKRLSDRARSGEVVTPRARPIEVTRAEVIATDTPTARVRARLAVSSGTYIRSFARDLGAHFNFPVHLSALRRTRVGRFHLDDARVWQVPPPPAERAPNEKLAAPSFQTISLFDALPDWPVISVAPDVSVDIAHGKRPPLACPPDGDFFVSDDEGELLAWGRAAASVYSWRRVFVSG